MDTINERWEKGEEESLDPFIKTIGYDIERV